MKEATDHREFEVDHPRAERIAIDKPTPKA
jgi:hypothetical protein